MPRGRDGTERPSTAGAGGSGAPGGAGASVPYVFKALVSNQAVASIIGKGGSVITALRASCQAKIHITGLGEVYPATDCRVLVARASAREPLGEVLKQIVQKLAESMAAGDEAKPPGGGEGDVMLTLLVPNAAAGSLIGRAGAGIQGLRERSGAKITISGASGGPPDGDKLVTVSGTLEALEVVGREVIKATQEMRAEPWFPAWASSHDAGAAPQYSQGSRAGATAAPLYALEQSPGAITGMDVMAHVAQGLPPYVVDDPRGFALSCVVPRSLVGGLIGRGGAGTREIRAMTGTKINIRDIPDDPSNQTLSIAGPLPNTCTAYMLMMKRYLDAEASQNANAPPQGPR
mmetsp:Transcript_31127/g.96839  ORF Transcript_31127/g.96839 Transcript_31127/m.96839 type:complete len:347 (-) Transcript_31127:112-1152(-)